MWNYNEIMKQVKRIGIPKEYQHLKIDKMFNHDYYIMMSIRKDAGKTTNVLLIGLILNYLYGETIEYLRNDESQIKKASSETMFDVILQHDYIKKLWNGEYNSIKYHSQVKKWNLTLIDDEGNIVKECETPCCVLHSLEKYVDIKSTYNNPKGNYIVWDEFPDTQRSTFNQIIELQNQISTIGRGRPENRVIMLGNNVSKYLQIYEELTIEKDVPLLNYGDSFEMTTEFGTTLYCELLPLSFEKKEEIKKKSLRFTGFNTPKMNAFNGLDAWQGTAHQHLPDENLLSSDNLITNRVYIHHRNRYMQLCCYTDDEFGEFVFVHYARKPKLDDNIILTLTPKSKYEFYGYGKFAPEYLREVLYAIIGQRIQNRWYYASNSVGDIIEDYFKEMER